MKIKPCFEVQIYQLKPNISFLIRMDAGNEID